MRGWLSTFTQAFLNAIPEDSSSPREEQRDGCFFPFFVSPKREERGSLLPYHDCLRCCSEVEAYGPSYYDVELVVMTTPFGVCVCLWCGVVRYGRVDISPPCYFQPLTSLYPSKQALSPHTPHTHPLFPCFGMPPPPPRLSPLALLTLPRFKRFSLHSTHHLSPIARRPLPMNTSYMTHDT